MDADDGIPVILGNWRNCRGVKERGLLEAVIRGFRPVERSLCPVRRFWFSAVWLGSLIFRFLGEGGLHGAVEEGVEEAERCLEIAVRIRSAVGVWRPSGDREVG